MLHHMTADSFLLALDRFVADRLRPKRIICDNGGNFVKGHAELTRLWTLIEDSVETVDAHFQHKIHFSFTAPYAPASNGLIERYIGASKRALRSCMPDGELTDEKLVTVFRHVAGLLNNRPLGYISNNPDDPESLTPNHFLRGDIYSELADFKGAKPASMKNALVHINSLLNTFWKRFVDEMATNLREYPKQLAMQRNVKVGDICVLLERNAYRRFPLVKVIETIANKDGLVRQVRIQYGTNDYDLKIKSKVKIGVSTELRPINRISVILPAEITPLGNSVENFPLAMDPAHEAETPKPVENEELRIPIPREAQITPSQSCTKPREARNGSLSSELPEIRQTRQVSDEKTQNNVIFKTAKPKALELPKKPSTKRSELDQKAAEIRIQPSRRAKRQGYANKVVFIS
jgi:hypothetical protein